jgi:hypothetical protein
VSGCVWRVGQAAGNGWRQLLAGGVDFCFVVQ